MSENLQISILKIELPLLFTIWEEESQFFPPPILVQKEKKDLLLIFCICGGA